jgi:hypothetical protein
MDDQLDNDLKKRIREVFEIFEDASADEGWLQLRKKFPEEKRDRRAFAWIWWGAAALLLVFFGIGLWIYNAKVEPSKITYNKLKHPKSENINNTKDYSGSNKTKAVNENNLTKTSTSVKNLNAVNKNKLTKTNSRIRNSNLANEHNLTKTKSKVRNLNPVIKNNLAKTSSRGRNSNSAKVLINNNHYTKPGITPQIFIQDSLTKKINLALAADSDKETNKPMQLNATVKSNIEPSKPATATTPKPAKSINSMFAEDKKADSKKSEEKIDKRVHLGVFAATYFNYAKGSNNQVNVGAGFTSDIKLSKNLKLVTGITIAQNSLNYAGNNLVTSDNSVIIAQSTAASSRLYATPNSLGISPSNFSVSSIATVKNYDASLVNLDIPLNLKYEFNPQKNDTYIIAGLSSGTFINETYTYQYSSQAYFLPSSQQTQGETTSKNFGSFYFAKMLNVAFGVGFPFGKNRLTVEPFLKYPIGGLGSQDIRFGSSGINLKFNFQSSKK